MNSKLIKKILFVFVFLILISLLLYLFIYKGKLVINKSDISKVVVYKNGLLIDENIVANSSNKDTYRLNPGEYTVLVDNDTQSQLFSIEISSSKTTNIAQNTVEQSSSNIVSGYNSKDIKYRNGNLYYLNKDLRELFVHELSTGLDNLVSIDLFDINQIKWGNDFGVFDVINSDYFENKLYLYDFNKFNKIQGIEPNSLVSDYSTSNNFFTVILEDKVVLYDKGGKKIEVLKDNISFNSRVFMSDSHVLIVEDNFNAQHNPIELKYINDKQYGVYLINLETKKEDILSVNIDEASISPSGEFIIYGHNGVLFIYNINDKTHKTLTNLTIEGATDIEWVDNSNIVFKDNQGVWLKSLDDNDFIQRIVDLSSVNIQHNNALSVYKDDNTLNIYYSNTSYDGLGSTKTYHNQFKL